MKDEDGNIDYCELIVIVDWWQFSELAGITIIHFITKFIPDLPISLSAVWV